MAVNSMTGFGQSRGEADTTELSVELKSVNHRFLDVSLKMPSAYSRFEADVAKLIKSKVQRRQLD